MRVFLLPPLTNAFFADIILAVTCLIDMIPAGLILAKVSFYQVNPKLEEAKVKKQTIVELSNGREYVVTAVENEQVENKFEQTDSTCLICLSELSDETKLPCNHSFHKECFR